MFEIGNSLREARFRQQLEFGELEQATKIRARYLRALEEESFDTLPAQTYVKGFLRTYADYLGLDGQLYVDEYNSRFGAGEEEYARAGRRAPHLERAPPAPPAREPGRAVRPRRDRGGLRARDRGLEVQRSRAAADPGSPRHGTTPKPAVHTRARAAHAEVPPLRQGLARQLLDGRAQRVDQRSQPLHGHARARAARAAVQRTQLWIRFGNPGNLSIVLNGKLVSTVTRSGSYIVTRSGITRAA